MSILDPRRHHLRLVATAPAAPPVAPPAPAIRAPFAGARIFANSGASALILPGANRAQLLEVSAWLLAGTAEEGQRHG